MTIESGNHNAFFLAALYNSFYTIASYRSTLRPAPYLLEAPEDIDQSAPFYFEETFDYGTSPGRSSDSRYHTNRTQSSDLFNKRRALLERER